MLGALLVCTGPAAASGNSSYGYSVGTAPLPNLPNTQPAYGFKSAFFNSFQNTAPIFTGNTDAANLNAASFMGGAGSSGLSPPGPSMYGNTSVYGNNVSGGLTQLPPFLGNPASNGPSPLGNGLNPVSFLGSAAASAGLNVASFGVNTASYDATALYGSAPGAGGGGGSAYRPGSTSTLGAPPASSFDTRNNFGIPSASYDYMPIGGQGGVSSTNAASLQPGAMSFHYPL
jgi:hypothetical protein